MAATLHRRLSSAGDDYRLVEDGSRLSAFLFAPAALLARKLWIGFAGWLLLVSLFVGAVAAGWLASWAAVLAVIVIHLFFAIDLPHLERARLQRHGWHAVALTAPSSGTFGSNDMPPPPPRTAASPAGGRDDVIGLFPGERA